MLYVSSILQHIDPLDCRGPDVSERNNTRIICIRQLLYERRMWSTRCAYETFLKKCSLKSLLSITIANEVRYQTKDDNSNDEHHSTLGVKYQSAIFNIWYKRCHKQDNNEYKYTPTDTKVCKIPFGPPLIHCSIIIHSDSGAQPVLYIPIFLSIFSLSRENSMNKIQYQSCLCSSL